MKAVKLLIGIALLVIGIVLASNLGSNLAGGGSSGITIPLGTVKIDYKINGK